MLEVPIIHKAKGLLNHLGSIRARLVMLVLLIGVPSITLMYYQAYNERQVSVDNITHLSQQISSQISQSQIKIIQDSQQFLERLSKEPFLQQADSPACSRELASLLRLAKISTAYINIGAPLANGDLLCNALPLNKKVNVYDRKYIREAKDEKTFSISSFQVDRAAGKVSVNFAYPVFEDNSDKVIALVVAVLSLDWWSERLNSYELPENSIAVITDSDNKIIANYPYNSNGLGQVFNVGNLGEDIHQQGENTTFVQVKDGINRVISQTVLYTTDNHGAVKFTVAIPIDDAIKKVNQNFYQSMILYVLLVCVASAFAMNRLNKNIVKPIENLVRATNNLELGRKTYLHDNVGANEIKLLATHFTKMSRTRLLAEEESLAKTKELDSVFTSLPDTYIRVSSDSKILDYKEGGIDFDQKDRDQIKGKFISDIFSDDIAQLFLKKIKWNYSESKPWEYTQINDGVKTVHEARVNKIHKSSEFVIIIRNITERKKSEETIWQHANFDGLTNLPNRKQFYEKLEQAIVYARQQNHALAVLFIDLDQFKEVNDTLGHHMGDLLLKEVGNRLGRCIRKTDLVARLGGDEFTIIIDNLSDVKIVEKIAQKILTEVHKAINLGGQICYTSPSIGISLFPENCEKADELIQTADQAMFAAKKMGRNRFNYYESAMQEQAMRRMHLINDLRIAIRKQEFHLVYQPIVDIKTRRITKVEALIRWQHAERGFVRPDEFIALAEETELIFPIGLWVVQEVSQKIDSLIQHFGDSFQLSINISPLQFMNQDPLKNHWFEAINNLSKKHNLVLEITEGLLMDASNETKTKFQTFADEGIPLAIDDFGTGYSSLAYINQYDIDFLKIDRSFVMNISKDSSNLVLCEAIIVMAHKLGMAVIAEGVETLEQLEFLANMECDFAQGYYFSKPCVFEDLISLDQYFPAEQALPNRDK